MRVTKSELRRRIRELAPPTVEENRAVVDGVEMVLRLLDPATVATYMAMRGELDLGVLSPRFPGIRWVVTRTPDTGWLTVHPLESPRERHPFGYEQPARDTPVVAESEIDVVLVPGLAFDIEGGRLGRGRGYYDELIARCRPGVVTVGITLDRCVLERIPVEDHDRRMVWLVTESGPRLIGR